MVEKKWNGMEQFEGFEKLKKMKKNGMEWNGRNGLYKQRVIS